LLEDRSLENRLAELERQVRSMRAAQLPRSVVGSGGITIKDGGKITFLDSGGAVLATLDENGVLVAGAPVLLDGDGLDVGSGLVVVDAVGVNIASGKVVLDSSGLEVDGGNVQAVWIQTGDDTAQNQSLNTTYAEMAAVTFDPPNWVQTLFVMATATGQFGNTSGSTFNGFMRMTLDDGGASAEGAEGNETVEHNQTCHFAITEVLTVPLSPAGRAVDVTLDARVNSGSTSLNLFGLKIVAFGVRSAFV
jgi:hypothetical protein